ncbi:hypothetical protein [Burkholderia plantarii]|nr:hypothetical protein [Burkholderia plantarii]
MKRILFLLSPKSGYPFLSGCVSGLLISIAGCAVGAVIAHVALALWGEA